MNEELLRAMLQQSPAMNPLPAAPHQLARAVQLYSMLGGQDGMMPQRTALGPMQLPAPPSGWSGFDPSSLMKMFGGLMGGGGPPPNPYAMGGGGSMDAGSMPMSGMA